MTVQLSPATKSVVGLSVKVVGPPLDALACAPLEEHEIVAHGSVTFTGSLKVTETFASTETPVAPESGEVAVTFGALSPSEWAPRPSKVSTA